MSYFCGSRAAQRLLVCSNERLFALPLPFTVCVSVYTPSTLYIFCAFDFWGEHFQIHSITLTHFDEGTHGITIKLVYIHFGKCDIMVVVRHASCVCSNNKIARRNYQSIESVVKFRYEPDKNYGIIVESTLSKILGHYIL